MITGGDPRSCPPGFVVPRQIRNDLTADRLSIAARAGIAAHSPVEGRNLACDWVSQKEGSRKNRAAKGQSNARHGSLPYKLGMPERPRTCVIGGDFPPTLPANPPPVSCRQRSATGKRLKTMPKPPPQIRPVTLTDSRSQEKHFIFLKMTEILRFASVRNLAAAWNERLWHRCAGVVGRGLRSYMAKTGKNARPTNRFAARSTEILARRWCEVLLRPGRNARPTGQAATSAQDPRP